MGFVPNYPGRDRQQAIGIVILLGVGLVGVCLLIWAGGKVEGWW